MGDPSTTAYAIFVEVARVWALTIDFAAGSILKQVPVRGFDNWGEITRVFAFDARRIKFYYLEANFTQPRPSTGRPLTLYVVDPLSGTATATLVTGAADFPAGDCGRSTCSSLFCDVWGSVVCVVSLHMVLLVGGVSSCLLFSSSPFRQATRSTAAAACSSWLPPLATRRGKDQGQRASTSTPSTPQPLWHARSALRR